MRRTMLVAGATAGLILVPTGLAVAANNGNGPQRNGDSVATCTYDQNREQLRLRDGTGVRHDTQVVTPTQAAGHRSGPMDGSGPQADPALDGTGNQWAGAD